MGAVDSKCTKDSECTGTKPCCFYTQLLKANNHSEEAIADQKTYIDLGYSRATADPTRFCLADYPTTIASWGTKYSDDKYETTLNNEWKAYCDGANSLRASAAAAVGLIFYLK